MRITGPIQVMIGRVSSVHRGDRSPVQHDAQIDGGEHQVHEAQIEHERGAPAGDAEQEVEADGGDEREGRDPVDESESGGLRIARVVDVEGDVPEERAEEPEPGGQQGEDLETLGGLA